MISVELCNLALGRIGQGASRPIQSLDLEADPSESARACARVFDTVRRAMLREFDWPFAQKVVALQATTHVVPGWPTVYAMPEDALKLHAVGPGDVYYGNHHGISNRFRVLRAPVGDGMVIASDLASAWAWYTSDADTALGDPLFDDAFAWRLASELGLGLKADPRMSANAAEQYRIALSKALATAANEGGNADLPMPETMGVRGV